MRSRCFRPGGATGTTLDLSGLNGEVEICLIAQTICGAILDPVCCFAQCEPEFVRGDCNIDGIVNIADGIYIMRFLFQGFPFPLCGPDDTPDALECDSFPLCD